MCKWGLHERFARVAFAGLALCLWRFGCHHVGHGTPGVGATGFAPPDELLPTGSLAKVKRLPTGSSSNVKELSTGSSASGERSRRLKRVKRVKIVRRVKKIATGLPALPLPDEMLSTGGTAKVKRSKRVKRVKKIATGLPALPQPDEMLSTGGTAKVKRSKKMRGETNVGIAFPWRLEAKSDLSEVARFYGADLASLEVRPMGIEEAKAVFQEQGVPIRQLMTADGGYVREVREGPTDDIGVTPAVFWEIFAGSCNLTKAVVKKCQSWPATGGEQAAVLPPIEIDKNRLASTPWKGLHTWDIQSPSQRRLAWAYLALLQPRWVHLAPPCTFWSPLARRCNRRTEADNERRRVQALAFLVFRYKFATFSGSAIDSGRWSSRRIASVGTLILLRTSQNASWPLAATLWSLTVVLGGTRTQATASPSSSGSVSSAMHS